MNLKEMSTSELTYLENDIRRELSYRQYHEGYKQGQFDTSMDSVAKITAITPQQQRDTIVEQAKKDVEKISTKWRPNCSSLDYGLCAFNPRTETVNFEVNSEKRTVVCYITYEWKGKTCTSFRGIAKCTPSDCFNGHIGKAIALRRALGLEVPAEYLNAPQPTEVRVGDAIEVTLITGEKEVKPAIRLTEGSMNVHLPGRSIQYPSNYARIIDDTREGVDGK